MLSEALRPAERRAVEEDKRRREDTVDVVEEEARASVPFPLLRQL
jgi:hypothetical protein